MTTTATGHHDPADRFAQVEDFCRAAFEHASLGMALVSPDGSFLKVNDALCNFLGYSEGELLARNVATITHPDELKADLAEVRRIQAGEIEDFQREHVYFRSDGAEVWGRISVAAIRDGAGELLVTVAQVVDVTLEKRAAERSAWLVEHAQILKDFASDLAGASRDPESVLDLASRRVTELVGDAAVILLRPSDGGALQPAAVYDDDLAVVSAIDEMFATASIRSHSGLGDRVMLSGEFLHLPNVSPEQLRRSVEPSLWPFLERVALESLVIVPLKADGLAIGTLNAIRHTKERPYDLEEVAFIQELADQIAPALANALELQGTRKELLRQQEVSDAEVRRNSLHDPLTGLSNRAWFLGHVEQAIARIGPGGDPVAVLFINIDDFSLVGKTLGAQASDQVLIEVANRLRAVVGGQVALARFGDDEFTALVSGQRDPVAAVELAEAIHRSLETPITAGGKGVHLTASTGIAFATGLGKEPERLVLDASAAMYRAKDRGAGQIDVFDDAMRIKIASYREAQRDMHRALSEDQLLVLFQPEVDLTTGEITAVEAFLRWEHPERGLVPAGEFIAVAEETGMVLPMGSWVLQKSCQQILKWNSAGPDAPAVAVSVNLSVHEFAQPDLVAVVRQTIEFAGIRPEWLRLEITEGSMVEDIDAAIVRLSELKALGVQIALDDFGTGFSSLSFLTRIPVDVLKIDRALIVAMMRDARQRAIVAAIVTLGTALGMTVAAEGVETAAEVEALRALGCHVGQGYFFSRPQRAEAFPHLGFRLLESTVVPDRPRRATKS